MKACVTKDWGHIWKVKFETTWNTRFSTLHVYVYSKVAQHACVNHIFPVEDLYIQDIK